MDRGEVGTEQPVRAFAAFQHRLPVGQYHYIACAQNELNHLIQVLFLKTENPVVDS